MSFENEAQPMDMHETCRKLDFNYYRRTTTGDVAYAPAGYSKVKAAMVTGKSRHQGLAHLQAVLMNNGIDKKAWLKDSLMEKDLIMGPEEVRAMPNRAGMMLLSRRVSGSS